MRKTLLPSMKSEAAGADGCSPLFLGAFVLLSTVQDAGCGGGAGFLPVVEAVLAGDATGGGMEDAADAAASSSMALCSWSEGAPGLVDFRFGEGCRTTAGRSASAAAAALETNTLQPPSSSSVPAAGGSSKSANLIAFKPSDALVAVCSVSRAALPLVDAFRSCALLVASWNRLEGGS